MVHVRGELPWIRSGPLFRVSTDAFAELTSMLSRRSFRLIEVDGSNMTSRRRAHAELASAFQFPDYYGHNWDAFNDCMGDFVEEHDGERVAVVWHNIAAAAAVAPATVAEVGWALLETKAGYMPSLAPGTTWRVQLEVFVIGVGDDFDRP